MPAKKQTILKNAKHYKICGSLWIEFEGNRCFGPGRMQLLQEIEKSGSINKAAKAMDMSYKKAWTMINELNEQFAKPMVITQSGGEGGGGSILTDAAKALMNYHEELRNRFANFLKNEMQTLTI